MKIFLKVRQEYEQSLSRGEEVVAGIPAYVLVLVQISSYTLSVPLTFPSLALSSCVRLEEPHSTDEVSTKMRDIDIMG